MGFSTRTRNALLNSMLGKTSDFGALASAPDLYLALFSGGTELSGDKSFDYYIDRGYIKE